MITRTKGRVLLTMGTIAALFAAPVRAAPEALTSDAEVVETRTEIPKLKAASEYKPKDGVVELELSEYAGYAGLIVANGGLEPSENSVFYRKHGFKVKILITEEENWSALNSGRVAAGGTTVDLLAVYGKQFEVVTPLLIGFSRGADGIVTRSDIKRINDLKGKVVASCQFTEADFFIRYLAQEAGVAVAMLADLAGKPDPDKINLVYCADAFGAGDLFLRDIKAGRGRLAGCVTWAPKTTEVAEGSGGKAKILVTNRNLLIIADVLAVNRGFAASNPAMVAGLVEGIMEGNHAVRTDPEKHLDAIARAFKWTRDEAKGELSKVHLANVPENLAFFAGTLDSAGSYAYIYETARYVYGDELSGKAQDPDRTCDVTALKAIEKQAPFRDQKASITPLRVKVGSAEKSPVDEEALLSRDIKFFFKPNSSKLDMGSKENLKNMEQIAQLLKVSPGSVVLMRGHADGSKIDEFRRQGGEAKVREVRLVLKNLAKARCAEIRQIVQERHQIEGARMECQGVGADEPTGRGPDADRRVEVQWFTLE